MQFYLSVHQRFDPESYITSLTNRVLTWVHNTGWSKKPHKVNDTIILQPYVIESCGFQQNVPKEISYVTKVNIW